MENERFGQLWIETKNMVSYNIRLLVENKDIVKNVNSFYKHKVLDDLWFTEDFACDYSQFTAILKANQPVKYENMKRFLYENSEIISHDNTASIIKSLLLASAAGSLVLGLLKKNAVALVASLGLGSLVAFLDKKQKEILKREVSNLAAKRLDEIGNEVIRILNEQ